MANFVSKYSGQELEEAVRITQKTGVSASKVESNGDAGTMASIDTSKFNGGSATTVTLPSLNMAVAEEVLNFSWTSGSVTPGSAASIGEGFYSPGTAPTMPTFSVVSNLVNKDN